jgi:ElaB/YqjD/DUF883 family membrane-anchored ribosome-binding protein
MDTQTTTPQTAADRAETVGHETKQAAGDVAATAGQEAKQVTREARDQARQLWSQTRRDLTDQAATQQTRVAGGLRELADQLGQMAGAAEQDGMARGLVDDAARRAGEAASWLDQRDPGSLLEETRSFARQRPGTFLAIAAGVGVLAGRLSRGLIDEARDSNDSTESSDTAHTASGTSAQANPRPVATTGVYGTGSLGDSQGNSGAGSPTSDLPGAHRTTQPLRTDGTPSPIDSEGHLAADGDDVLGKR